MKDQDRRAKLETTAAALEAELNEARGRLEALSSAPIARGDASSAAEIAALEERVSVLLNKWVTASRLRSSRDPAGVIDALGEVLETLIGVEKFGIELSGVERPGADPLGEAVSRGKRYLCGADEAERADGGSPIGWVPLLADGDPMGGIVIYKLFAHKRGFCNVDVEILDFLSRHAVEAMRDR